MVAPNKNLTIAVIAPIVLAIIISFFIWQRDAPVPEVTAERIPLQELPPEVLADCEHSLRTAGMHTYQDSANNTYVLLTYGDACGYAMYATPHINGDDVYFRIYACKDDTHTAPEYEIYKTNGVSISANTPSLLNPEYCPGVKGVNLGWITVSENTIYCITPILDVASNDDAFIVAGDAYIPSSGMYRYEYTVRSTGTYILSAVRQDTYSGRMRLALTTDSQGNEVAMDPASGLQMRFDEAIRAQINQAVKQSTEVNIKLSCGTDGPVITGISEPLFIDGLSMDEIETEAQ